VKKPKITAPPEKYPVTTTDVDRAWKILADRPAYFELSEEEKAVVDALIKAGNIQKHTGHWPTFGEVTEHMQEATDEYWLKRFGKTAPR
jgi:hypothetical protein